jgi:hypothetical protein
MIMICIVLRWYVHMYQYIYKYTKQGIYHHDQIYYASCGTFHVPCCIPWCIPQYGGWHYTTNITLLSHIHIYTPLVYCTVSYADILMLMISSFDSHCVLFDFQAIT